MESIPRKTTRTIDVEIVCDDDFDLRLVLLHRLRLLRRRDRRIDCGSARVLRAPAIDRSFLFLLRWIGILVERSEEERNESTRNF